MPEGPLPKLTFRQETSSPSTRSLARTDAPPLDPGPGAYLGAKLRSNKLSRGDFSLVHNHHRLGRKSPWCAMCGLRWSYAACVRTTNQGLLVLTRPAVLIRLAICRRAGARFMLPSSATWRESARVQHIPTTVRQGHQLGLGLGYRSRDLGGDDPFFAGHAPGDLPAVV